MGDKVKEVVYLELLRQAIQTSMGTITSELSLDEIKEVSEILQTELVTVTKVLIDIDFPDELRDTGFKLSIREATTQV